MGRKSPTRSTRPGSDKPRGHLELSLLIEREGGPTAFIRRVWPHKNPRELAGKVHKWHKGENAPTIQSAFEIADAFGMSLNEIWGKPDPALYPTAKKIRLMQTLEKLLGTALQHHVAIAISEFETRTAENLIRLRKDLVSVGAMAPTVELLPPAQRAKRVQTPRKNRQ